MGKKKGKHILMPPFSLEWPKVELETEDKIISVLTLKLQEFPSLESKRTKDARKKLDKPEAVPRPELSKEEEEKLKARLKEQVVIGHRQVSRGLELNQLSLVMVSGDAQPQVLLHSLLPLVVGRKCPAVCLSSLQTRLTDAIGVTSVLAVGFKKIPPGEPDDFGEFVNMAVGLVPPPSLPWVGEGTTGGSTGTGGTDADRVMTAEDVSSSSSAAEKTSVSEKAETTATTAAEAGKEWPLMEVDQEKDVMDRLMELLKPYTPALQKPKSKLSPEEQQTRKTINLCMMVDLGAMRNAAHSGLLDLLLVQCEGGVTQGVIRHPYLQSAVQGARERGCPVLHLVTLKKRMSSVVRDTNVRAVGFKKILPGLAQHFTQFQEFITFASQYSPSPPPSTSTTTTTTSTTTTTTPTPTPNTSQPMECSSSEEATATEPAPKEKKKPKTACPVYDVSGLYVYKNTEDRNTSSRTETEKDAGGGDSVKRGSNSEAYISLSSEPTVQYLGVKGQEDGASISDVAFVDSSGCGIPGKKLAAAAETANSPDVGVDSQKDKGAEFSGIMGLDSVDAPAVPAPFFPEPRPKKVKASLKRTLDRSTELGEFVSFKIRPTSVKVSLPNPGKKKHKKFKKK